MGVTELIMGWKTDSHYVNIHKSADVEQGWLANKQHVHAISQMQRTLAEWKSADDQKEFTTFCCTMDSKEDSSDNPVRLVVDAAMVCEGLGGSGVTQMSQIQQDWEPTARHERFPQPREIAEELLKTGSELPCFLLPPSNPLHVPPHIVAFWLMSQNLKQKEALSIDSTSAAS